MPVNDFIRDYTDKGTLYHGTPSMVNGLSAMRSGFFLSTADQGRALVGAGWYNTSDRSLALREDYVGKSGVVLETQVRHDERLNILDWDAAIRDPEVAEFLQRIGAVEDFRVLVKHGVDIVVRSAPRSGVRGGRHVLVQNGDAVISLEILAHWRLRSGRWSKTPPPPSLNVFAP